MNSARFSKLSVMVIIAIIAMFTAACNGPAKFPSGGGSPARGAVTNPQATTAKDAVHNGVTQNGTAPAIAKSAIGSSVFNSPIGAETPKATEVFTSTPEAMEVPEATEVPEVTEKPEETEEPEAMEVPEVTHVPEPTERPEATHMLEATDVAEPTERPEATYMPEATDVLEPTERPEATHMPEATRGPEPTETDRLQTNALHGIVNAITGDVWTINGQNIIVDSQTLVINTIGVGNWVTVQTVIQSDGSLLALEVKPGTAIVSR